MNRLSLVLGSLLLWLSQGPQGVVAQQLPAGSQWQRIVPRERSSGATLEARYKTWTRLLQAGSAQDRRRRRQEMAREGQRYLPLLKASLTKRNHFLQRQVLLVLMALQDPGALPELVDLASGALKGAQGLAALALGSLGSVEGEAALLKLRRQAHGFDRLAAILSLGRLGGARGLAALETLVPRTRQSWEKRALLLALGMGGRASSYRIVQRELKSRNDLVRRAATTALGFLESPQTISDLVGRLADEDPQVRRLALEGLARRPVVALSDLKLPRSIVGDRDRQVLARLALLLGRLNGALPSARLLLLLKDRRSLVRTLAVAACLNGSGPGFDAALKRALSDPKREVRHMALLVSIARAFQEGRQPGLLLLARDPDAFVRRAALLGSVYLLGARARRGLEPLTGSRHERDVAELAQDLLARLARYEASARAWCEASLQVLLDASGGAASWNLNASLNRQIQEVLGVASAREEGPGVAPGTRRGPGNQTAGRSLRKRPAPRAEDLRLHLVDHPYLERRPWREFSGNFLLLRTRKRP